MAAGRGCAKIVRQSAAGSFIENLAWGGNGHWPRRRWEPLGEECFRETVAPPIFLRTLLHPPRHRPLLRYRRLLRRRVIPRSRRRATIGSIRGKAGWGSFAREVSGNSRSEVDRVEIEKFWNWPDSTRNSTWMCAALFVGKLVWAIVAGTESEPTREPSFSRLFPFPFFFLFHAAVCFVSRSLLPQLSPNSV